MMKGAVPRKASAVKVSVGTKALGRNIDQKRDQQDRQPGLVEFAARGIVDRKISHFDHRDYVLPRRHRRSILKEERLKAPRLFRRQRRRR